MNELKGQKVNIAGIDFINPVIAASGTFGFGREYAKLMNLNQIGGVAVKGITLLPRMGNKPVRIAETPSGILNSVGLENPGVDYFIENEIQFLKKYDTRIIVNIAGNTVEEYVRITEKLNETDIDMIEVNISCPNVKEGCLSFGSTPEGTRTITEAVKKASKKPIAVKLTPNVTDIGEIAIAAEYGGADCISLINTITGMVIDTNTRKPILYNNTGGLSGPAIRPVAVRMTYEVCKRVNIPVIGMGGITCALDALQFIIAGAHAVMIGTASFMNPTVLTDTVEGIRRYMMDNKIISLDEIRKSIELNG